MSKGTTTQRSQTDWARIDAMEDRDIDLSDIPEIKPEDFARAVIRKGLRPVPPKQLLTLRLDADVLAWFRKQGRGYQSQMNAVLKAYKEAHETSMRR